MVITVLGVQGPTPLAAEIESPDDSTLCVDLDDYESCLPRGVPDGWSLALESELMDVATSVYEVVGRDDGYADLGLDFANRAVDVYYRGPLPPSLDAVLEQAQQQQIRIDHVDTLFGAREIEDLAHILATELNRRGIKWNRIQPYLESPLLEVAGPGLYGGPISPAARIRQLRLREEVREAARAVLPTMEIRFVEDTGPYMTALSSP